MRPSTLLRTISSKLSPKLNSSSIAPWPPLRSPADRWLDSELDELRINPHTHKTYTSATFLSKTLTLAIATQKNLHKHIKASSPNLESPERRIVDDYLEDVVELLDACNVIRERVDTIVNYVNLVHILLHSLEGEGELCGATIGKIRSRLGSCEAIERRCAELDKCGSNLRRLGEKTRGCFDVEGSSKREMMEVMSSSRGVALFVVGMVGVAFCFKSKRGVPSVNGGVLGELGREVKEEFEKRRRGGVVVMDELEGLVGVVRRVREMVARSQCGRAEREEVVEEGRRMCREVEERVRECGGKVDELYKEFIGIRVSLLGMVSH